MQSPPRCPWHQAIKNLLTGRTQPVGPPYYAATLAPPVHTTVRETINNMARRSSHNMRDHNYLAFRQAASVMRGLVASIGAVTLGSAALSETA